MTKRTGKRGSSPTLHLTIAASAHDRAMRSNSGGCLIVDAIKEQYPHLSAVSVDMATIRVSDGAKGLRYTYLTPSDAQHLLLAFDQGWKNPLEHVTVSRAVKIERMTGTHPTKQVDRDKARAERIAYLEAKLESGEPLTSREKASLTRMTNPKPTPDRPSKKGPVTDIVTPAKGPATVVGGDPIPHGQDHPNLLRGRNRHFGARLADPGIAFNEAVEQAVLQRLAEFDKPSAQL